MALIHTLIVDDEALARARLRRLLGAHPDVEIIAECGDGRSAIQAVHAHRPQLMFLDIQMPEIDGFALLSVLGELSAPTVVFVTAYEQHAVRAFDAEAVDYLVKPFDAARLARALSRARARTIAISPHSGTPLPHRKLYASGAAAPPPARLPIRVGERFEMIELADINYLVAEGNYVAIHTGNRCHLIRETLSAMVHRLDPRHFVRIHRSRIVRIEAIQAIQPLFHGEYQLTLRDGTPLTSARGYREQLRTTLGLPKT